MKYSFDLDWTPTGYKHFYDYLVGGRMPIIEKFLILSISMFLTPFVFFATEQFPMSTRITLSVMTFVDAIGLVYVSTNNAKRKYHPFGNRPSFPSLVVISIESFGQIVLFDWLVMEPKWNLSKFVAPAVLISVITVSRLVRQSIQRPISFICWFISLMILEYSCPSAPYLLKWFVPLLLVKYIIAWAPRAEPYVDLVEISGKQK